MSQSRLIPETERAKYTRNPPDGIIDDDVDIIDCDKGDRSNAYKIGGLEWRLAVGKRSLNEKEFLYVSLFPEPLEFSTPWSIELTAEYILCHDDDDEKNVSQMHHYILRDLTEQGCYLFPWEELMDKEKGFIRGDFVSVEIRLTILKGLRCTPAFDFASSGDARSDVVLLIEGKSVHVNKHYLGLFSPVFQTMFFGEFAEKGKDEVELNDVQHWVFIELLNVIYPCQRNISAGFAEDLIELADRFQIQSVIDRAEDVLIAADWYPQTEKMRIADKYKLFKLLGLCLAALEKTEDVQAIKNDPIYEGLSDTTKVALLERVLEFSK